MYLILLLFGLLLVSDLVLNVQGNVDVLLVLLVMVSEMLLVVKMVLKIKKMNVKTLKVEDMLRIRKLMIQSLLKLLVIVMS